MTMFNTVTEQFFRVITSIKNNNTIFVYIQCFKAFKMLNGSGTFGS